MSFRLLIKASAVFIMHLSLAAIVGYPGSTVVCKGLVFSSNDWNWCT